MMKRTWAGLLILLLVIPGILVTLPSSGSDGAVTLHPWDNGNTEHLDAGSSITLDIAVQNTNADPIFVKVVGYELDGISKVSVTGIPTAPIMIEPGIQVISLTVVADRYAATQTGRITFTLSIAEDAGGVVFNDMTVAFEVDVYSSLSAGSSYNHIMGIWPSSLDPAITALISFVLWIVVAFALSYLVLPFIISVILKERDKLKGVRRYTWRPFFFLIMLYGTASCARIYGIGEEPTAVIDTFVNIAYIAVGALVVWRVYREVLEYLSSRMSARSSNEMDSSLRALLELIGKIFICVIAIASILASLGFNLMVIITGAGIAGLAISLGAQNTLSQFFSGITLLMTKPFRAGDLITIDGGDVLMVKKVGLMTTEFDKWNTNSIFVLPNNKVATAGITNITRKTDVFQTSVQVNIEYDSDIKRAKDLMLQAAAEHPRVIKTRSPSVRVSSLEESCITMSLSVSVDDFKDAGSISGGIREAIIAKFKENGIRVATPKMDVNIAGRPR